MLAAASPYFQQLLEDQITPTYILKTDVSDDVWGQILEYIYTGHTGIANEHLDTVVEMAEQFGLENLSQELNEIQAENLVSDEDDVDDETSTQDGDNDNGWLRCVNVFRIGLRTVTFKAIHHSVVR